MPPNSRPLWIPLVTTPYGDNALCLELANTLSRDPTATPLDGLLTYDNLLDWIAEVGALPAEVVGVLRRLAMERPRDAEVALAKVREVRETVYHVFSHVAAGRPPLGDSLRVLNELVSASLAHLRLDPESEGGRWTWSGAEADLGSPLWPIALSAAELMTSPLLERVRECGGDTCGWMFLDLSPNRSRRWCEMASCGNRAKARRFHQRRKA